MTNKEIVKIKGGSFILDPNVCETIFTPEDLTDEQIMMHDMTRDFVINELIPYEEQLEKLDYELTKKLLRKAAELGLLGVDVPEQFGGLGLDKVTSNLISEVLAKTSSFIYSIGTQTGIGSLPIVYFGTKEQKDKYLPAIVTGEKFCAYCLTEPSSGSDALSSKTTAVLSNDKRHYILNGSKVFITNGGFADIYIVYAKVDGKHFSAFIVDRETPGFTVGPEEKKMGLKASSTCSLFFENVMVPVENLLGEVGKGHLIAFNILNLGRLKLPTNSLGTAKEALELSVKYANSRKQFNTPISQFPLIAKKIAEMNINIFALETMVYRIAGLLENTLHDLDHSKEEIRNEAAIALAEYAIECSISKVFGTEVLDFVVDEGVQIHGGYGFIQEYKIERMYRDSRITRIFEGTNEINRLLIPGTLIKKAMKLNLSIFEVSTKDESRIDHVLYSESHLETKAKNIFRFAAQLAKEKYKTNLEQEQEVMLHLADLLIQIYAMGGVLLRTKKIILNQGKESAENTIQMTQVFVNEAFSKIEAAATEILATIMEGEELEIHLNKLKDFTKRKPLNTTELKREIAKRVINVEKYLV